MLESLREIDTFDRSKVVPPEYVNFLNSLLRIHFLDDAGTTLNTHDGSRFNLMISNTQKIILKRQSAEKTPTETLFSAGKQVYERGEFEHGAGFAELDDLYGFDELESEADLSTNQRFEKLRRLEQLGMFVDEAHHAFGNQLERDLGRPEDEDVAARDDRRAGAGAEAERDAGGGVLQLHGDAVREGEAVPRGGVRLRAAGGHRRGLPQAGARAHVREREVRGVRTERAGAVLGSAHRRG